MGTLGPPPACFGGGPVGLMTALELHYRGVDAILIEQNPTTTRHPKMDITDFAQIATDMGAFGVRVTDPSELVPALDAAVASGRPAIVDVISDATARAPNRWMPEPSSFLLDTAGDS